jgi:hypothetical protein
MKKQGASSCRRSAVNAIDGKPKLLTTAPARAGAVIRMKRLSACAAGRDEGSCTENRQDQREHEGDIRQYRLEVSSEVINGKACGRRIGNDFDRNDFV